MEIKDKIYGAIFGLAVGDALGVPVEFLVRAELKSKPVSKMQAFGSHNQPAGTWSDDSSLTFCLAEMLSEGYDVQDLANRFVNWYNHAYWTPHGEVFDVGVATSQAIHSIEKGENPLLAGGEKEHDNGNGALMRILPLLFHIKDFPIEQRFEYVSQISSLTHRHIRSILACFIYIEYALELLSEKDKLKAFNNMVERVNNYIKTNSTCTDDELNKYHRILQNPVSNYEINPIYECPEDEISSSGYVVHSLEAALWCFFKANTYKKTVLDAVNLGHDTDTTAAIAGGLAGVYYGYNSIPKEWIDVLAKKDEIENLCKRFSDKQLG